MPSVINTNIRTVSSVPSERDFVSDEAVYYSEQKRPSQSPTSSRPTLEDLKENHRRRQWSDPDDEFSVPIHTEYPLIGKNPLDRASFLLNYRAMHRSIEIMAPPSPASQINEEAPSTSSTPHFYPTIPDGPFYIHHRSTITGSSLSNVVSCPHVHCFEHNRHLSSIARSGATSCQKPQLMSSSSRRMDQDVVSHDTRSRSSSFSKGSRQSSPSPTSSSLFSSGSANDNNSNHISQEHSFLESHIASISQWLSSNTGSA